MGILWAAEICWSDLRIIPSVLDLINMSLHLAVQKGDFAVVRHLVESGSTDVNEKNGKGLTPLMLCSLHDGESWALGVARMLLTHGGRVGLGDACGRSALTYAILYKRLPLTRLLLQALDYDLRRPDCDGHSALWYAEKSGDDAILKVVLQKLKRFGNEKTYELPKANSIRGQKTVNGISLSNRRPDKQFTDKKPLKKCMTPQLPYKTLPAFLWTQKQTIHKAQKMYTNYDSKLNRPSQKREGKGSEVKGPVCPPPKKDWRLPTRKLTGLLQDQLSPSYRPRAQPLPQVIRPRRRLSRLGAGSVLEASLRHRRQRDRKMSLGAIDDSLRMEGQRRGDIRRRCSVAVIPLTRLQAPSRLPSMPPLENLKLFREVKNTPKPTGKRENTQRKI